MVPPPKAVTNATTMQPIKSISFVPAEMHPEMALENVPMKSAAVVIGESMAPSDMVIGGMRPPRSWRSSGSGCETTMLAVPAKFTDLVVRTLPSPTTKLPECLILGPRARHCVWY